MESINYKKEALDGMMRFGVGPEEAKRIIEIMAVSEKKRKRIKNWEKIKYPKK